MEEKDTSSPMDLAVVVPKVTKTLAVSKIVAIDLVKFTGTTFVKVIKLPFKYWMDILFLGTAGLTIVGAIWWFTYPYEHYPRTRSPREAAYEWWDLQSQAWKVKSREYYESVLKRVKEQE